MRSNRSCHPLSGARSEGGFSVIELMTVVSVVAILAVVALPTLQSVINTNRLASASNELIATVQTLRQESLRRGRRLVLCPANGPVPDACGDDWSLGWVGFVDANGDSEFNAGEEIVRTGVARAPVLMSEDSDAQRIVFRSDGFVYDTDDPPRPFSGVLRMCVDTTRPAENQREILVGFGRTVLQSASGECG